MGFLRWLRQMLSGRFAGPRTGAPSQVDRAGRHVQRVDDYLELLEDHPGSRTTQIRILGSQASEDRVGFRHERIETEDDRGNARQVDVYEAKTCSFGHMLDQEVRVMSVCQIQGCGAVLCSAPGCSATCECGASCCPTHRKSWQVGPGRTVTYCSICKWRHYWKLWWGLRE